MTSAITVLLPVLAFILVFIVLAVLLFKTEILGDNKAVLIILALIITALFIAFKNSTKFIQTAVPSFAILTVIVVFVLVIAAFAGSVPDGLIKTLGIIFTILLALIFVITALNVFSDSYVGFFPGQSFGTNLEPSTINFLNWLYTPKVGSTALLAISVVAVIWVLVKS